MGHVRGAYRRVRRVCLVMPTGAGKTATASTLITWAVAKGHRVLFLVHRREIVRDTHRRLVAAGVDCGLVMAGEPTAPLLKVQVASVQTIAARGEHPPANLLVWDECHHVAAQSYRDIAAQYPDAWHLGLTATPERSDGVGLRDAFDEMVVGCSIAELQTTNDPATGAPYLASCDVVAPARKLDSGVLASDPVEAWQRHAQGRPTVVFAKNVAESKALARAFSDAGVEARHIDGQTPADERDAALAAFARGDVTVLCNVYVLTEGWDAPRAKVCLLARGCGSVATFLQMVGRVLRAHQGERALLIDLAGVVHEHGLPEEERDFSLDGIRRKAKKARPWIRQCLSCGFTVLGSKSGSRCERCGTVWPVAAASVVAPREQLATVDATALPSRAELKAAYLAFVNTAMLKGYAPGWAGYRFKEEYGFWPRGLV